MPGTAKGIVLLEEMLAVVVYESPDVTLYDSNTLEFRSQFTVPGLRDAWDMTGNINFLFISELKRNLIHRIQLLELLLSSTWPAIRAANKLSITKQENVIVTNNFQNTILEYTSDGILVREIPLPSEIDHPRCSVQLDNNQFLVSHCGSKYHRVCLVDDEGTTDQKLRSSGRVGIRTTC